MEEQLLRIVYQYFPRGIDSRSQPQEYNASKEFNHLCNIFDKEFEKQQNGEFDTFYDELQSLDATLHLHKYGLYNPNERAHNLQMADLKVTTLYSICLNISIIAPYYTIYILETNVERYLKKPVDLFSTLPRNTFMNREIENIYEPLLQKIKVLTEQTFKVKEFPFELINTIIPDINHNRIKFGDFSMFNAFFLDKYTARI